MQTLLAELHILHTAVLTLPAALQIFHCCSAKPRMTTGDLNCGRERPYWWDFPLSSSTARDINFDILHVGRQAIRRGLC
jgi:hypothetical protein